MPKLLLTTIQQPLGVNNETCTTNIQAEMYHAQVTLAQDVFSIRAHCTGWGLEFIAANLESPTTVLHYPTKKIFLRELKKGYDFVGISFVMCTFPKTLELCEWIRKNAPDTKIILGGYGTVLEECDQYADYVCREEGVNYLKKLLGENPVNTFKPPQIKRGLSIMSVTTRSEAILPIGLGCSRGCEFCCTSHYFNKNYIPLLKTGKEINEAILSIDSGMETLRNIAIVDEDFLSDREKIMEMTELNAKEIEKPIFFSCLTSLKSLSQYTTEELLSMGLFGAWAGIESEKASYSKLKNIDPHEMFSRLKQVGINMLASVIIGYDWHDEKSVEKDFEYLLSLKPTLSQIMIYSPCPQTPLYKKLQKQDRLVEIPYKLRDGFHLMFKHPNFSSERLEALLFEFYQREYEELGASIFRIMEVQLMGYKALQNNSSPLFRSRAREYKKLCLEIYPLIKTGISKAPSQKVKDYLRHLKERTEATFEISRRQKIEADFAKLLYYYTKIKDNYFPKPIVKTEFSRYNFDEEYV